MKAFLPEGFFVEVTLNLFFCNFGRYFSTLSFYFLLFKLILCMQGKVAIFDDDHDILELCSFILQQKGFEVLTRPDCRDLLETVTDFKPDVILMDNWIPEAGGIDATQRLKAEPTLRQIPIIYFSANNDIKSLAAKAGADKFLAKPFDIDALENLVTDTVNESRN